ncbi:hypothetical protein TVAG_004570 [Trichomonas vaginalis G3]|uniref:Uncharacterized protein n=1 Tax=Trichomonas vaginalis (strain ATCC PRA-98 / G3) TaxID=412133 RepID=A2DT19_TRIV3|nr:GTPase activation domain, GAP family [Trichomonas vaginalis G3]EAY16426.1 hypothetical protein TVAG_004570 [Trichomonas vaginalis G3]KAI5505708.1 GTPase activation domain, GAP family [Trichomonas vaginalis G3]|eukprot:XP_001328649.1 hypothetical protein [Trichomonas vaginalis G3]
MSSIDFSQLLKKQADDNEMLEYVFSPAMQTFIEDRISEVNNLDTDDMDEDNSELFEKVDKMVSSKFPIKLITRLNNYIPFRVPKIDKTIYNVARSLIYITHRINQPFFFLDYVRHSLFRYYNEEIRDAIVYSPVLACSLIASSKKSNTVQQWAILTADKKFYYIKTLLDKPEPEEFPCCDTTSVKIDEKKQLVSVLFNEKVLYKFKPSEPSHVTMWGQASRNFNTSFGFFGALGNLNYPSCLELAFYISITSPDYCLVKTFVELTKTCKPLIKIFEYRQKMESFISNVISMEFTENIEGLTRELLEYCYSSYGQQYYTQIIQKLKNYIATKGDFLDEKAIFTVLKYICDSASLMPQSVRVIFYIYSHYTILTSKNDIDVLYQKLLSLFFGVIILPSLPSSVSSQLLQVISIKSGYNKRMMKHGVKMISEFFRKLCTLDYSVQIQWTVPVLDDLFPEIRQCFNLLNGHSQEIIKTFVKWANSSLDKPSQISWAVSSFIIDNFGIAKDKYPKPLILDLTSIYDPEKTVPPQFAGNADGENKRNNQFSVDDLLQEDSPPKKTKKAVKAELNNESQKEPNNENNDSKEIESNQNNNEKKETPLQQEEQNESQESKDPAEKPEEPENNEPKVISEITPKSDKLEIAENDKLETQKQESQATNTNSEEQKIPNQTDQNQAVSSDESAEKKSFETISDQKEQQKPEENQNNITQPSNKEENDDKPKKTDKKESYRPKLSIEFIPAENTYRFLKISDLFVFIDNPDPDMPAPQTPVDPITPPTTPQVPTPTKSPRRRLRRGRKSPTKTVSLDENAPSPTPESPAKSPRKGRGRRRGRGKTVEAAQVPIQVIVQAPVSPKSPAKSKKIKEKRSEQIR